MRFENYISLSDIHLFPETEQLRRRENMVFCHEQRKEPETQIFTARVTTAGRVSLSYQHSTKITSVLINNRNKLQ